MTTASQSSADTLAIRNAMTIDVEDYFQVSAFAPYISRSESWNIAGLPRGAQHAIASSTC
jgi:hypothetical protein